MTSPRLVASSPSMANNTFSLDSQFGPVIPHDFDFTRLFEDTILSILPSALFLCLVPFRLLFLRNKPRAVNGGALHYFKLVTISVFITLQIVCLALWTPQKVHKSGASLAAASVAAVTAIALGVLSLVDHFRSIRPSSLINVFILLSLPMDVASVRTIWTRGGSYELAAASTSTVVIKAIILIIEAIEKRDLLFPTYRNYSPESTSGIYNKGLFWWINPLLRSGFKKILTNDDLYPLDVDMKTHAIERDFHSSWARTKNKKRENALLWRTLWVLKWPLAKAIFPRLCVTFFQYLQPFLISGVLNFLQSPTGTQSTNIGWGLTAAYGLAYTGLAIAKTAYQHQTYRMTTIGRGVLVSMIYAQTVDLKVTSVDESAAITLMSADVERICLAFEYIHNPWSSLLDAAVGAYLLQRQVGIAALGPVVLCSLASVAALWVATRYASKFQRIWVSSIQTRIDATSKMLGGMKAVKMLGLTDMMRHLIRQLRLDEVSSSLNFRKISVVRLVLGKGSEVLAPGMAFAAFAAISNATGEPLDLSKAYSSLNIVTLMAVPLAQAIQCLTTLMAAISCFSRIQDFLNLPVQKDHRLERSTASSRESGSTKLVGSDGVELSTLLPPPSTTIIETQNARFAWDDSTPIIQDLTISIKQGSFNFLVGPVGCGKSTLCKGLVGETPSSKGWVYTRALECGFVDQTPWIQNDSVQNNVLGESIYDRDWYNTVIHGCCLQEDIAILPKGDQTQVGSAGISLSGGQKQRLALARAVYSKEKLLVLDDCFSGLDATTEERIFSRLLGRNGILRKSGTTVILATHAAHRLSYADNILVLDTDGRLSEEGTFSSIMHGNYLTKLAAKHTIEDDTENAEKSIVMVDSFRNPAGNDELARAAEDVGRAVGDWETYVYFFRHCGWLNTAGFIGAMIGFGLFMRMPDVWVTYWVNAVQKSGTSVNGFYLAIFLLFELISVACLAGVGLLEGLSMTPKSARSLHGVLLDTVMAAPLTFFTTTDTGVTLNRFSQDLALVDNELPGGYIEMAASLVLGTIQGALMCTSAGPFAATLPFVLIVMWVVQKYYLRTSRQLRLLDLEAKSPLYSHFGETLEGLVTIRAFGWSKSFEEKNDDLLEKSQKPFYLLFCVQRWLSLVLDLTVAGLTVVLMVLIVKLRANINPGFVGIALVNVNGFNLSLTELIKAWTLLETSMGAISRIKTFSEYTVSENLPTEDLSIPANTKWPSQGRVEIKDLWAGYKSDEPVLRNLTISIKPGQKVGICGPSGSGKSSIIATLFRMLETSSGSFLVDGLDIAQLPRQTLRENINAIPQDAYMFKGTIRLNVDPLGRHTDEERRNALGKVGLWSVIEAKGGLDAPAEVDMFSHGQRQLFCLARAILHPSKIVVLDEVTSSVDIATDETMQRIIREEFDDCTIIAVAHRLNTVMDFDMIATLKAGELVEFDTPQALMARDSAFKALYDSH